MMSDWIIRFRADGGLTAGDIAELEGLVSSMGYGAIISSQDELTDQLARVTAERDRLRSVITRARELADNADCMDCALGLHIRTILSETEQNESIKRGIQQAKDGDVVRYEPGHFTKLIGDSERFYAAPSETGESE